MPSKIGIIIFVAYVVWQIVYSVTQSAQKKEQQRRARELAEQRRRGGSPPGPPTPMTGQRLAPPGAKAPASTPGTTRLDDLAERRRRQLEQLRKRRATQAGGSPQVRVGGSGAAAPPTSAVPAPPSPPVRRRPASALGADRESLRAWEDTERQRKERQRLEEVKRGEEQRRRRRIEARQRKEAERKTRRAAAKAAPAAPGIPPGVAATFVPGGPVRGPALRRRIADRQALRELFVLKELIEPPLGLREPRDTGEFVPGDPL